jgi:hypothetical protein
MWCGLLLTIDGLLHRAFGSSADVKLRPATAQARRAKWRRSDTLLLSADNMTPRSPT